MASAEAAAHWQNFIYIREARHWRNFWCRWKPDGTLTEKFRAERIFRPLANGAGCTNRIVYHYPDERGTVKDGPLCGPWTLTEQDCSRSEGLIHPARKEMTTLLLPGGNSGWCWMDASAGQPCAAELFLHYRELRMSAGIVHSPDGSLKQLALIKEDASGAKDAWPHAFESPGWTESAEARVVDGPNECLGRLGIVATQPADGHEIYADLRQETLSKVKWRDSLMGAAGPEDLVCLCGDTSVDRVAIVAPRNRTPGAAFGVGAVWWPPESPALFAIEARWDGNGALVSVRHLKFLITE